MNEYQNSLIQGKKYLMNRRSQEALKQFSKALELCETDNHIILGEILFFLGTAFMQLGETVHARRCWLNGFSVRENLVEEEKKDDPEWRLFQAVQISRYLQKKRNFSFSTLAEGDMINDLIRTTWEEISSLSELQEMNTDERIAYYFELSIIFPSFQGYGEQLSKRGGKVIPFFSA